MSIISWNDLSPENIYVSLDLETTGLNPGRDEIIEIGAVKFNGSQVLDTMNSLVNPYSKLSDFTTRFTGITQGEVDQAPSFGVVSIKLNEFLKGLPIIGHNISFDLDFLSRHGLSLSNESIDTWDMAWVLFPSARAYSLSAVAEMLGIDHSRAHRALEDASAAHKVFIAMLEKAAQLKPGVRFLLSRIANQSMWRPGLLLGGVLQDRAPILESSADTLEGLNPDQLKERISFDRFELKSRKTETLDQDNLASLLSLDGALAKFFLGYEHRPQQVDMLRAVTKAFNCSDHLIVEAGTGVGKSLAYLLPAIYFAVRNGKRVVVSTNTINLQEQLLKKDIPMVSKLLEKQGLIKPGELRVACLKGRANYLCLQRWSRMLRSTDLSMDEARILAKISLWLQNTSTGDRGELNLTGKTGALWSRLSSEESGGCPGFRQGICFLRAARDRAEQAHIVVVNHALLLTDITMDRAIIPQYDYLVVDEAHHLEEEATRHLGFDVPDNKLTDELDVLFKLISDVQVWLKDRSLSQQQRQHVLELISAMEPVRSNIKHSWTNLWSLIERFLYIHQEKNDTYIQLRLTSNVRTQPDWSSVEVGWENVDVALDEGLRLVEGLFKYLEQLAAGSDLEYKPLLSELSGWMERQEELKNKLRELLGIVPPDNRVDWASQNAVTGALSLNSSPLEVGTELEERLFSRTGCVILTSATLADQGKYEYIRKRIGFMDGDELLLDSPFDYLHSALLLVPSDMPEPYDNSYFRMLTQTLIGLGESLKGRTLALFTSYSSVKVAYKAIRDSLEAHGIKVLAQGVDGPPARLLDRFVDDPRTVLLGTSSFWEGVDLSGGILKALVLTRLPFNVPTEPVFAARADLFEDSFREYAVPQAVLRFRQGFGRLIRSKEDKGVVAILDSRVLRRNYGRIFLESIPTCTVRRDPLAALPTLAREWVEA